MANVRRLKSKDLYPMIFSRHAAAYQQRLEQIMARGEARGRERVITLLRLEPGMHVLDLACGPGTLSRPIATQVGPSGEVIGVDLAEGMIALARATRIPHARFQVNDAQALRQALATAGFVDADVEVIDEKVRWDSAEQLVSRCMSWWDLASRLDGVSASRRQAFRNDAAETLRREHPGAIETMGRTHAAWAIA